MKVLMLTPYLPYPLLSGGQIRTYNLLKKLSTQHEITLFALIKNEAEKEHIPELQQYCSEVKVFRRSETPFTLKNILKTAFSSFPFLVIRNHVPEVISAVKKELTKHNYDLIHAETFYMMPHIPATKTPILLVEQTIEYLGYESYAKKAPIFLRPFLSIDIAKIRYWEQYYWNLCQRLIVMSDGDKEAIAPNVQQAKKIEVVENGVDTQWFAEKAHQEAAQPTVLSVGTFKWLPNVEAVSFLVEQVWPKISKLMPSAQLHIVGNAPTDKVIAYGKSDSQIKVIGRIPDIRDAFKSAHVLAAPVFSGKGTRYKILGAMATETPIVATSIATEGLGVADGVEVMIANTADEMATKIVQLLKHKSQRVALAKAGKAFVTKKYNWQLIAKKLDRIYQTITTPEPTA